MVIPFANYVMSQDRGESFNGRRWLPLLALGLKGVASRQLVYSRWKTSVIGLCSGLRTLTIMVPSAARV